MRAYPLDVLCSNTNTKGIDRLEMEIAQGVGFFQIGVCNNRDLLVYKRKKNTASVFMALEPTCNLRDSRNEKLLTKSTSFFGTKPDYSRWFKKYQVHIY